MKAGDVARVTRCGVHKDLIGRGCPTCQLRGAIVMVKTNFGDIYKIVHLAGPVPARDVSVMGGWSLAPLSPLELLALEAE